MNLRLYLPSLATLFAFMALGISVLFLQDSMGDQARLNSLETTPRVTKVTSAVPITMVEPVEAVDIGPLSTRPLFSPIRRVPDVVVPTATAQEAPALPLIDQTPQPETPPPPVLVMIGMLLEGLTPKALIRDASGSEQWVEKGAFIQGWQVIRISAQSITLQLNDESVDIYSID